MNDEGCREVLRQLPPLPESARTVVCTLYSNRPMTGKELREATRLPRRTLYTALQRLKEAGVLSEQVSLRDSRQSYYWLKQEVAPRHGVADGGEASIATPAH